MKLLPDEWATIADALKIARRHYESALINQHNTDDQPNLAITRERLDNLHYLMQTLARKRLIKP
jgi:hypothetical protein